MDKINQLLLKLQEQARLSRDVEAHALEVGLDAANESVADEIAVLQGMTAKEIKDIRKEFDLLKKDFRATLNKDQEAMYDRYEALGAILGMLSNGQQK